MLGRTPIFFARLISFSLLWLTSLSLTAEETPTPVASIHYEEQIQPLLTKYCWGCHSGNEPEGGIRLDSSERLLQPYRAELRAIIPGKSRESGLIQLIEGTIEPQMPPEGEPAPSADELQLLKQWIEAGAVFTKTDEQMITTAPQIPLSEPARPAIYAAAWHPNGKNIAFGQEGQWELVEAASHRRIGVWNDFPGAVSQLVFSPDGKFLYCTSGVAGRFAELRCYSLPNGQLQWTQKGHDDAIYGLAIHPEGTLLATGSYDRSILLWDAQTGRSQGTLNGHHGSISSLAFHPNGQWLASASEDKTVKLWDVKTQTRIATLSEPTMAQNAVLFHPAGKWMVAVGQDKRVRIWEADQRSEDGNPPLWETRFAHDAPILTASFSPDGQFLFTTAEDQSCKIWETQTFTQLSTLAEETDWVSALAVSPDSQQLLTTCLNGDWHVRPISQNSAKNSSIPPVKLLPTPPSQVTVNRDPQKQTGNVLQEQEPNNKPDQAQRLTLPVRVSGVIHQEQNESAQDVDVFQFSASPDQALVIETKAARQKSPVDTKLEIVDEQGQKIPWLQLRSLRDSYITFRPIDSTRNGLRMHNWEEVRLNDYLYLSGEVIRVFQLPRGPDADFGFYTQQGKRRAYFGTSGLAHALEDPIYIVEPYPLKAQLVDNGLPVFPIYYENDDEETQRYGKDSRLIFTAPHAGDYWVCVSDVRGFSGSDYKYELEIRPAEPQFTVSLETRELKVPRGSGRRLLYRLERIDGFEGAVQVEVKNLPAGLQISSPILIEAGHIEASAVINASSSAASPTAEQIQQIEFVATGTINQQSISQTVPGLTNLEVIDPEKLALHFLPDIQSTSAPGESTLVELAISPGETITALLKLQRMGFEGEIKLDVNNLPHGIIVDNIGLSGVLIRAGENERQIFLTAADWVQPQERWVHAMTLGQGNQTSLPVLLRVRLQSESQEQQVNSR